MCEFVSWIEAKKNGDTHYFFMTDRELRSKRGGKLIGAGNASDICGHGFLREYFELGKRGKDWECTDFSMPDNFPADIVAAIKNMEMTTFGIGLGLLTPSALAEYKKIKQSAWEEYKKIQQSAWEEYEKIKQPAWEEYEKIQLNAFWRLFKSPGNRAEAWR